jgi:hypothetical protein
MAKIWGKSHLPRDVATPHAGAGRLALVPLAESWAVRRFVIVTRPTPLLSAAARLLAENLHRMAG